MVVNSWSNHRGKWRDAGFSNDASPKTTCHVAASQLSESNALSPFGGREPSAKVQLSYDRTCVKNVAGANSFDQMQRPGVKGPCAARNLFSIAHPPGKCNPRWGFGVCTPGFWGWCANRQAPPAFPQENTFEKSTPQRPTCPLWRVFLRCRGRLVYKLLQIRHNKREEEATGKINY